jgi:hypothetical protein
MTPRRRSTTNTSNLPDVCNITATFLPFLVSICDKSFRRAIAGRQIIVALVTTNA